MVTSERASPSVFDHIIRLPPPAGVLDIWALKLSLDSLTPWDETLFVDADSIVVGDLLPELRLVNEHGFHFPYESLFAGADPWNYARLGPTRDLAAVFGGDPERAARINGGFIGWARSELASRWFAMAREANAWAAGRGERREELAMMLATTRVEIPLLKAQGAIVQMWCAQVRELSIARGQFRYRQDWEQEEQDGMIAHFGSYNCEKDPYLSTLKQLQDCVPGVP